MRSRSLAGLALLMSFGCASLEGDRATFAYSIFSGAEHYEYLHRMTELFPASVMTAAESPFEFSTGEAFTLPDTFPFADRAISSEGFLSQTDTSALLILQDGAVRYERYMLTGGRDVHWMSYSVAKSFTSALVGLAVAEGRIGSIEEPVTKYVPWLGGSAYDGVRIKDILQMSSGARWNEDYSDPDSDIVRFARTMAEGGDFGEMAAALTREREPGVYNHYNSMDTLVLGMLLTNATGRTVTSYMEEKLWHPLGMEAEGYWLLDNENLEMTFAGLNATARDFAKLGELYRNGGRWNDKQIIQEDWVRASTVPDAPHLMPGDNPNSNFPLGYGYQWWVLDGDEGEYSAIGVYNQFIYVNPTKKLVIVKLSANSDYGTTADGSGDREFETIEFFRAIGRKLN